MGVDDAVGEGLAAYEANKFIVLLLLGITRRLYPESAFQIVCCAGVFRLRQNPKGMEEEEGIYI